MRLNIKSYSGRVEDISGWSEEFKLAATTKNKNSETIYLSNDVYVLSIETADTPENISAFKDFILRETDNKKIWCSSKCPDSKYNKGFKTVALLYEGEGMRKEQQLVIKRLEVHNKYDSTSPSLTPVDLIALFIMIWSPFVCFFVWK